MASLTQATYKRLAPIAQAYRQGRRDGMTRAPDPLHMWRPGYLDGYHVGLLLRTERRRARRWDWAEVAGNALGALILAALFLLLGWLVWW